MKIPECPEQNNVFRKNMSSLAGASAEQDGWDSVYEYINPQNLWKPGAAQGSFLKEQIIDFLKKNCIIL